MRFLGSGSKRRILQVVYSSIAILQYFWGEKLFLGAVSWQRSSYAVLIPALRWRNVAVTKQQMNFSGGHGFGWVCWGFFLNLFKAWGCPSVIGEARAFWVFLMSYRTQRQNLDEA